MPDALLFGAKSCDDTLYHSSTDGGTNEDASVSGIVAEWNQPIRSIRVYMFNADSGTARWGENPDGTIEFGVTFTGQGQVVPEPSAALLAFAGLAGMFLRRSRRTA